MDCMYDQWPQQLLTLEYRLHKMIFFSQIDKAGNTLRKVLQASLTNCFFTDWSSTSHTSWPAWIGLETWPVFPYISYGTLPYMFQRKRQFRAKQKHMKQDFVHVDKHQQKQCQQHNNKQCGRQLQDEPSDTCLPPLTYALDLQISFSQTMVEVKVHF